MRQKWTKWVSVFVMIVMLLSVILPSLSVLASNEIVVTPKESDVKATDTVNPEVSLEGKGEEDIPDVIQDAEPLDESSEEPEDSGIIVEEHTADAGNEIKVEERDGGVLDTCYISAYAIDEAIDGTEPFDANDDRGNDSNDSNKIVRSFDSVNYTLKYTTALRDASISGIDAAYVMVDFILPCDPSVAAFNLDTMQWCVDRKVIYTYEDGTTSSTWNQNKTVVSQQLTGRRFLQNTEAGNTIPGTGTLSVGITVKMAPNGYELKPSFTIWMEGNSDTDKKTVEDTVVVSAAPKYDVAVSRNANADILGYYNAASGQAYSTRNDVSDIYGRLQGYALSLSLYNDSSEKGLKGIEILTGEITFDLRMSETRNGTDVSYDEFYQPFFWDYRMNVSSGPSAFGRDMSPLGQGIASYTTWQNNMPLNKRGNALYCCYDGGTMVIVQDDADPNLLHVTLNGYAFDKTNLQFPDRDSSDTAKTIADNVGYFSVGYIQTICQFPSDVSEIENIVIGLAASNLKASSLSGDEVTTDVVPSNNIRNATVTTYPKGSHTKRNFFYSSTGGTLAVPWSAGNAYAYVGQDVQISGQMIYTGDSYLTGTNILQKFDDKYLEIPAGTTTYRTVSKSNGETQIGTVKTLFAAKPDKTGWKNDTEMNDTREEQLIYFDSIDALNAAGYTCVGVLYEVRDSQLLPNNGGGCLSINMLFHIKTDVPSGTVAMTKNDVRSWGVSNPCDFSWEDVVYDESVQAYGLGDVSWSSGSYTNGYIKPTYTTYLNYRKAVYKDGTLVSGHTNGYQGGNSLLIISNKVGVGIQVNDMSDSGRKSVYDMDAGERTASFVVTPTMILDTANTDVSTSDIRDDVTVTVTLPDSLHYQENGVSVTPDSVTVNADGTTTIMWTFADVPVMEGVDPIVFSTTIGDEGTVNDVVNNQSMTIQASVTSVNDVRAVTAANGNYSETSISVIKLAASSVTKRVLQPLVESGQEIGFRLRYSNLSEIEAEQAVLYDILSYVKDTVGSDFSGDYRLTRITMDYSHAPKTYEQAENNLSVWLTEDETARTDAVRDEVLAGNLDGKGFATVSGQFGDHEVVFADISKEDVTAIAMELGDVFGNEYVDVYFYLSPMKSNGSGLMEDADGEVQQPGDVYANRFYQNSQNQAAVVISNVVEARVVNRVISGLVWVDKDHDGVQDAEDLFEGAGIQLYRTTPSGFDDKGDSVSYEGMTLYSAYDVFGKPVDMMRTGKDGQYVFDYLEAGTYVVVVSDTDGYYLTDKDTGEDDSVDSDATSADDGGYISEIVLPELENMTESTFVSEHHDTGLVRHTEMVIRKETASGEFLSGAELSIYHEKDIVDGKPVDDAVPIDTWVSDGTEHVLRDVLLAGETYVLYEEKAPDGYLLADPVVFTVKDTDKPQEIVMVDAYQTSSLTLHKLDENENDLSGVTFRLTFLEAKGDVQGSYLLEEGESLEQTTDASGQVRFENLNRGLYEVTEVKTVDGQTLLPEPIQVELPMAFTEEELADHPDVDLTNAVQIEDTWYFFDATYEITNRANLAMPVAGGQPTVVYLGLCLGLVCMACLFRLIYKKR